MLAQAHAKVHKVKTVFQYARGYIKYSGCQNKTNKHANKYTGKIHDVQINIVQQRISKTKNYGGKGRGEGEKKSKCFPGEIAAQKNNFKHHIWLYGNIYNHAFKMLDASFQLFSREGVGGEGKRAHAMEGEAKKEDGQGEGVGGWKSQTHTHACMHAHTHTHSHHRGRHEGTRGGRLLWLSASQMKFV